MGNVVFLPVKPKVEAHPWVVERRAMEAMSDAAVKRLWDAYDGTNSPSGFSGEAIHWELNARGHGVYCAV